VHLGEAGVSEDAALADAELTPGDVLTGLHDQGIALDRSRAALLRVRRRGRGQRSADAAPAVADPDGEAGDRPDRVVGLVLVAPVPGHPISAAQSVVRRSGLDTAPRDRLVVEIGDEPGRGTCSRFAAVTLLAKPGRELVPPE
jgi:hypothetical protein